MTDWPPPGTLTVNCSRCPGQTSSTLCTPAVTGVRTGVVPASAPSIATCAQVCFTLTTIRPNWLAISPCGDGTGRRDWGWGGTELGGGGGGGSFLSEEPGSGAWRSLVAV